MAIPAIIANDYHFDAAVSMLLIPPNPSPIAVRR